MPELHHLFFNGSKQEKQTEEVARNEEEDGAVDDSFGAPQGFSDYKKNSASKGKTPFHTLTGVLKLTCLVNTGVVGVV